MMKSERLFANFSKLKHKATCEESDEVVGQKNSMKIFLYYNLFTLCMELNH